MGSEGTLKWGQAVVFLERNWLGCEVKYSPSSSAEVEKELSYASVTVEISL